MVCSCLIFVCFGFYWFSVLIDLGCLLDLSASSADPAGTRRERSGNPLSLAALVCLYENIVLHMFQPHFGKSLPAPL